MMLLMGMNMSLTKKPTNPIDLTTLLQKPTTQSSISTSQHQTSLLQFSQQAATDSLKAAVGISTTKDNSAGKEDGGFGGNSAPSAATAGSYSSAASSCVAAASSNTQQQQQQKQNPAVEMPGDSL